MGDNTLATKASGQTIDVSCVNQYKIALDGDIVPRSSGVPTAMAGENGTATYPFSASYSNVFNRTGTVKSSGVVDLSAGESFLATSTINNAGSVLELENTISVTLNSASLVLLHVSHAGASSVSNFFIYLTHATMASHRTANITTPHIIPSTTSYGNSSSGVVYLPAGASSIYLYSWTPLSADSVSGVSYGVIKL